MTDECHIRFLFIILAVDGARIFTGMPHNPSITQLKKSIPLLEDYFIKTNYVHVYVSNMCPSKGSYSTANGLNVIQSISIQKSNTRHTQCNQWKGTLRAVLHTDIHDVKGFISCTASSCCQITENRDLKWHIADVISIIWMFHFGHNLLEPHSAHFSSRSFLSVSPNPFSILPSRCKLRSPSTSWPNRELKGLFAFFCDKTTHRIL